MPIPLLFAPLLLQAAAAQAAGRSAPPPASPGEIANAAPRGEWVAIAPADLLVIDLAPAANGKARRVVVQLMPAPFSAGWVANIRRLAAAHWWDGTSVNRVQDNYVAQWGDATERKPLPPGLSTVPESAYETDIGDARIVPATAPGRDAYAGTTGWWRGFAVASGIDGRHERAGHRLAWPVHCYGSVGVGRDLSPNTGSGAELYAVIGHAPRHLDRNIAVVGRVVAGMEYLSSLPRGTGTLGFYERAQERVPILRIRLATDLAEGERPRFKYLSTDGATWPRYQHARENREPPFFRQPAGGADVCNIPVPVRPMTQDTASASSRP